MYDCQRILLFQLISYISTNIFILQNIFGYAICCVVGTIFARIECCSQNQDLSEKLKKRVGLIKDILMFVAVAAVIITTTTIIVAKTAMQTTASENTTQENNISIVPTTLKTTLTDNNWTETNSPAFSTTTVTGATSFFSHCPDYLNHLSNVLYSEQIGCILADIDNMTFQSFDEALKRCK